MIQIYNPEYYYKIQEYYATEVLLNFYFIHGLILLMNFMKGIING